MSPGDIFLINKAVLGSTRNLFHFCLLKHSVTSRKHVKINIIGFEMVLCPHLQIPEGSTRTWHWRFVSDSSRKSINAHLHAPTGLHSRLLLNCKGEDKKARGLRDLPTFRQPMEDSLPTLATPGKKTQSWFVSSSSNSTVNPALDTQHSHCTLLKEISQRQTKRQKSWLRVGIKRPKSTKY